MTEEKIIENVKRILGYMLGFHEEDISLTYTLSYDLGADSLDIVELLIDLEDVFDIEIEDYEIDEMSIVQEIINLVVEKTNG